MFPACPTTHLTCPCHLCVCFLEVSDSFFCKLPCSVHGSELSSMMSFLKMSLFKHSFSFLITRLCVDTCAFMQMPQIPELSDPPEAGVTVGCEYHVGAQNQEPGWSVSLRSPPVSRSPVLRLQAHTAMPWCLRGLRIKLRLSCLRGKHFLAVP